MRKGLIAAAVLVAALACGAFAVRQLAVSGVEEVVAGLPSQLEGVKSMEHGGLEVSIASGGIRLRDLRVVVEQGDGELAWVGRDVSLAASCRLILAVIPPLRALLLPKDGIVPLGDLAIRDLSLEERPDGGRGMVREARLQGVGMEAGVLAAILDGGHVDDPALAGAMAMDRGEYVGCSWAFPMPNPEAPGSTRAEAAADSVVIAGMRGWGFADLKVAGLRFSVGEAGIGLEGLRISEFSPGPELAEAIMHADADPEALGMAFRRAMTAGRPPFAAAELEGLHVGGGDGERLGADRLALRRADAGGHEVAMNGLCLRGDILEETGLVVQGLSRVCVDGRADLLRRGDRMRTRGDLDVRDVGRLAYDVDYAIPGGVPDFDNPLTLLGATLNGLTLRYEDRGGLARLAFNLPFPESLPVMIRQELDDILPGPVNAPLVRAVADFVDRPGVLELRRRGGGAFTAMHLMNPGGIGSHFEAVATPGAESFADAVARLRKEER